MRPVLIVDLVILHSYCTYTRAQTQTRETFHTGRFHLFSLKSLSESRGIIHYYDF